MLDKPFIEFICSEEIAESFGPSLLCFVNLHSFSIFICSFLLSTMKFFLFSFISISIGSDFFVEFSSSKLKETLLLNELFNFLFGISLTSSSSKCSSTSAIIKETPLSLEVFNSLFISSSSSSFTS